MLRILIADDVPMVRAGLRMLLEMHKGWSVCGEAADGKDAVEKAIALTPDVILLRRLDAQSQRPASRPADP